MKMKIASNFTRINGEPGVRFGIIAEGGANVVFDCRTKMKKEIEKYRIYQKDMK